MNTPKVMSKRRKSGGQLNFTYVFHFVDHLGNIRLKYTEHPQTGETTILEENHYYPYGLKHTGYNPDHRVIFEDPSGGLTLMEVDPFLGDSHTYKFGGKEYQNEFDINTYDFGARNYDPALGRWMNIDPIEHYYQSPYVGFDSNPVFYADPTGTSSIKLEGQAAQDFFGALKDEVANKRTDEYRKYFQQVQEDVGGTRMAMGADGVMNLSCGCLTPPCNGEIRPDPKTWVDDWAESNNIFIQMGYEIINEPYITFQALNPFDNQVTTLQGEDVNNREKTEAGTNTISSLIPLGKATNQSYGY